MSAATGAPEQGSGSLHLRLPATSANLGPGFDAAALALALYLEIHAETAPEFRIEASGRSPEICGALQGNLLLDTYRDVWSRHGFGKPPPLHLKVHNEIPLGMGCGSSAASRLAAIALAGHFAGLGWSRARMLDEAAALEHHPDNAAACCLGGFAVAGSAALDGHSSPAAAEIVALTGKAGEGAPAAVQAVSFPPPAGWYALLVLPGQALATTVSRAVLPDSYARADVVANLQSLSLLVAAFAVGDARLLRAATQDRLHQPYRGAACQLLPRLLPLAGSDGILSVTLSGAGSGVLCLLEDQAALPEASARIRAAAGDPIQGILPITELLACAPSVAGAVFCSPFQASASPNSNSAE